MSQNDSNLGPQFPVDSVFTARLRLHQSRYRADVLGVPFGTGPFARSTTYFGNMLTEEDAQKGLNFLTPEIFNVAKQCITETTGLIEEFRLMRNMLSSQPMCFNLFGLMVDNLDLATQLWRAVVGDEVERVTQVGFEVAPEPKSEYLGDKTAFDAFIEYRRPDGKLAFTGIECKLTEPFSKRAYDSPAYRFWTEIDDSPWKEESRDRVANKQHNQLWRDHLLAVSVVRHDTSKYAHGRLMLVRHPGDTKCETVVQKYQKLLRKDDDTFIDMPLDKLIASWSEQDLDTNWRSWLDAFKARYLSLEGEG